MKTRAYAAMQAADLVVPAPEPYRELGTCVLEQAISDYRYLRTAGLVVRDQVVAHLWSRRSTYCQKHGSSIRTPVEAKQLIDFFMDGGWDDLAALLNIKIPASRVCRELGIIE